MTVRKIEGKQGKRRCSYCPHIAVWRGFMWGKVACADHLPELTAWDRKEQAPDYSDAQFVAGY